jgi:integrase/recombinase XerD
MARPTSRVSRVLMTGPLAPFADAYRAELRERGYAVRSTVNELRQAARVSCWLAARGLTAADLSGAHVDEFLVWQRAEGRYRSDWSRPGLRCLLDVRFVEGPLPDRGIAGLAAGDVTAAVLRESESVSVSAAQNFVSGLRWFLRFCFIEGLVRYDSTGLRIDGHLPGSPPARPGRRGPRSRTRGTEQHFER